MEYNSPEDVTARLRQAGVWSKKRLGQHFLLDRSVLEQALQAAQVSKDDTIVEIGPGLGVLSSLLLEEARRVIAFEIDSDMRRILAQDLPNLEVVPGDVLQTAYQVVKELGLYKIVANIPYQITTPLLRLFLEGGVEPRPTSLTLLVQKEVGRRLAAEPCSSGRGYLSVLCQYYAEVTYVATVLPTAFYPSPAVDSALVHLRLRAKRQLSLAEEQNFFRFVHALFVNPRKQLRNVIAAQRRLPVVEVGSYLDYQDLPATVRAQELSLDQWCQLYQNQP